MGNNKELFIEEMNKLIADPKIQRLQEFPQHHGSNTLRHCIAVAKRSFELAETLGWDIDERELARCAMLCMADKDIAIREVAAPEVRRAVRVAKKIRGKRKIEGIKGDKK